MQGAQVQSLVRELRPHMPRGMEAKKKKKNFQANKKKMSPWNLYRNWDCIYMESRKIVRMILHAGQQWRHEHKEHTFGHSWRKKGWSDLREWHWSISITICSIDSQWEFDTWCREPKASAQDGVGREEGWGSRGRGYMYTCGWFMVTCGKKHHNIVR